MPKLSLNASTKTKRTPAGVIPVDWSSCELGEIVESLKSGVSVLTGNNPVKGEECGVLKVSAVRNGKFISAENKKILPNQLHRATTSPIKGSVIICRSNTLDFVGSVGLVLDNCPSLFLPDTLWQIRFRESAAVEPAWINAVLSSDPYRIRLKTIASGTSANMKKLQKPSLLKIAVPLPPLPEQRRISKILTAWDRSIETLEFLIDAKKRRKKALMQQFLSGKMRLPGFSGRWSVRSLGDVAKNVSIRNNGKFSWEHLYAVTKAAGMIPMRDQVRGVTTKNCKLVKRNFFAYNPMRLNIGSLARWQGDEEVMVSGDYIVFQCKEGELEPRYFDHLRRTRHWQHFVNAGGSGSVRVRLYFKDIAPFEFPCPDFKEQEALANFFDKIDHELHLHRQHLDSLRTQKRGLMQKLLTGEIRTGR